MKMFFFLFPTALVAEGFTEPGQELKDAARVQSEVDNSSHNGALVLCNPGALRTPESESQTPGRQGTIGQLTEGTCSSQFGSDRTAFKANDNMEHLGTHGTHTIGQCYFYLMFQKWNVFCSHQHDLN